MTLKTNLIWSLGSKPADCNVNEHSNKSNKSMLVIANIEYDKQNQTNNTQCNEYPEKNDR